MLLIKRNICHFIRISVFLQSCKFKIFVRKNKQSDKNFTLFLRFFLSKTTTHSSLKNLCPSSLANFSVTQRLGVSVTFFWAFRFASGFPLYLCSLNWVRDLGTGTRIWKIKNLKNHSPLPIPRSRIPFPVPLAKDAAAIPNATGYEQ